MDSLGRILEKNKGASAQQDFPTRNERTRLVLPDRVAAERELAERIAKYRDKPPKLSSDLKAKLGIRDAEAKEVAE